MKFEDFKNIKEFEDFKKLKTLNLKNYNEFKELIYEVLTPIGYNMMVTPKEIDFVIEKLSDVIGNRINKALHDEVN